jgi:metal-responsive CopG/Arc/MetJ family transcriptional regulator
MARKRKSRSQESRVISLRLDKGTVARLDRVQAQLACTPGSTDRSGIIREAIDHCFGEGDSAHKYQAGITESLYRPTQDAFFKSLRAAARDAESVLIAMAHIPEEQFAAMISTPLAKCLGCKGSGISGTTKCYACNGAGTTDAATWREVVRNMISLSQSFLAIMAVRARTMNQWGPGEIAAYEASKDRLDYFANCVSRFQQSLKETGQ